MATNQFKGLVTPIDSEATEKPQPSKNMNGGSEKIDGANPESPSTIPGVRRADYQNFISKLNSNQRQMLGDAAMEYKNSGLTADQILEKVFNKTGVIKNGLINNEIIVKNSDLNLKNKGNFDAYETKIDEKNADSTYLKAVEQLDKSVNSLGSLQLASENFQYTTGSTNVYQINNLIKEIRNAYTKGVYDTATIAKQLGVDEEIIRKIQQGKASELVSIGEEFAQEKLKSYFRAEEDYDRQMQRTMEDYNLAKTNLDAQFNSAMQTIRRNLFDAEWGASVGSAVAGISGSEYMVNRVQKQYQQNMDDLENNYMYSSLKQRASYIRAIQDYNTNIERLGEDFDDAVKQIQLSVLQQFQEIDNKIMTAEDNLKALGNLKSNTSTAMADAILKYIQGIDDENERQTAMQNFIAANYGYDVSRLSQTPISYEELESGLKNFMTTYADKIAKGGKISVGWCGEPVNKYLKMLGSNLSISQANDLAKYATDDQPTIGAIAYFDGSQSRATDNTKKYGHTGIVVRVNPKEGTVTLLDSNGSKSMGLGYTTYKLSDVTGYYTPTKGGASSKGNADEKKSNAFIDAAAMATNPNWSVTFQKEFANKVQDFVDNGNYDGALEYILSKSTTGLGQEEKNQLNAAQNALGQLASIQIALNEYEKAGGETGIFAGTEEQVAAKIGKVIDPDLRALATQINTAIINYRKAITGAGFSAQETKEYQSIFPSMKNSKELNTAIIDGAIDGMLTTINAKYSDTMGTQAYLTLLNAYEDATGSQYDLWKNKQNLMKYLKGQGYVKPERQEVKTDTDQGTGNLVDLDLDEYIDAIIDISDGQDLDLTGNVFTGGGDFDITPFGTGTSIFTGGGAGGSGGRQTTMQ